MEVLQVSINRYFAGLVKCLYINQYLFEWESEPEGKKSLNLKYVKSPLTENDLKMEKLFKVL